LPIVARPTPKPDIEGAISADNATRVTEITHFGKGRINQVRLSPDGKVLAIATSIGIDFYDTTKWEQIQHIHSPSWVNAIAFEPNSEIIFAGSNDGKVRRWHIASGALLSICDGLRYRVEHVAMSADGPFVAACAANKTARLWKLATCKDLGSLQTFHPLFPDTLIGGRSVTYSAVSGANGRVTIQDTETRREIFSGSLVGLIDFKFLSRSGAIMAAATREGAVKAWQISSGRALLSEKVDFPIANLLVSPDGTLLTLVARDGVVKLWDINKAQLMTTLMGYAYDPPQSAAEIAFSPDGQTIVVNRMKEGDIKGFAGATGQLQFTRTGFPYQHIVFAPNGRLLAWGEHGDGKIREVATSRVVYELDKLRAGWVRAITFQPSQIIAAGITRVDMTHANITLADVESGRELQTMLVDVVGLTGNIHSIESLTFSADGTLLVSESMGIEERGSRIDITMMLWDTTSGQKLFTAANFLRGWLAFGGAFSPDGTIFANQRLTLWNMANGRVLQNFNSHTGYVWQIAFSPDSSILASVSEDFNVKLTDTMTGRVLQTLSHTAPIYSVAFSPDGKLLATASADGTVRLWGVK
jgi:WD40 repeat protein